MASYEERIKDLFSRHQSVAKAGFSADSYKPGLDAMRLFDEALGHPSSAFRSIHVAGTNGKGSVCSMIASALAFAGYRVGLYTSPHLVDFRERIKVVGASGIPPACGAFQIAASSDTSDIVCEMISREGVTEFLDSYEAEMDGLTFFEVTTGMAFWWFARRKVDFAVIETGLGGRLDSTNIITPEVSVVTSIGPDHCALLGNTRREIAGEKAGIFKKGVPAVVGVRDEECGPVFESKAAEMDSALYFADSQCIDISGYELDLKGPCQDMNLRTALTALSLTGAPIIRKGLEKAGEVTSFRGRWEYLQENVICDIGHNPPALKENFARLKAMDKPLVIIYGIMADKDLDAISSLMPSEAAYILTAPSTPRALPVPDLHRRLTSLRADLSILTCDSVSESIDKAFSIVPDDGLIYIGGSTYVVSEAMEYFKGMKRTVSPGPEIMVHD